MLRRTCRRVIVRIGEVQEEITSGVTSLPPHEAGAAVMEALWRGHWSIENLVHHVRDGAMAEDAGQAHTGNTPRTLAALRNALLGLLRARGWSRIADALRHYGAAPDRALALIGARPARL